MRTRMRDNGMGIAPDFLPHVFDPFRQANQGSSRRSQEGLGLGLATAKYLNGILSTFPGLPLAIDFFLFQPVAAWSAIGLLAVSGIAAGIYPAWRAASCSA